ncbi:PstS family phosphate ABC transporter substrate-binding protein [Spongiibacter sp. KMU-158]|uniref:PstS family phosphate ABC transporter substrate-binding protein n=1 Tax=Spongiibacter pelagi TaxID=2760804 RepID=A0A927GWP2_9GAMM|nr:PstS family phosphate ABC transporter substrate-binding protein [Spongiibacter pelagi]MBD2859142.1 PstS family phosphate ABC transporter substrate-binding protein [Spongiibacter pelagi]
MNAFFKSATKALVLAGGLATSFSSFAARENIDIVGSSTVYPFATVVAERFGRATGNPTPKIESTGSGGGMKLFCDGVGLGYPDITNASRRIKRSEFKSCQENGVKEIIEVPVGFDGIVIANSLEAEPMSLTRRELFLALAAKIPGENQGELIDNPNKTWKDVNPELPAVKIEVLGPPPTSGTRDAFVELAMEVGCESFPWVKSLSKSDKNLFKSICHSIREDGMYVEAGENDNLIVQKLQANPAALGIFGFSFLDQNADKVRGSKIEGVEPSFDNIADKSYPVSRPLYFYVKKAHVGVVPGIEAFLHEFTSEKAWGDEGYLADKGMIPLPKATRDALSESIRNLKVMTGQEDLH